jgi:hypothetical protein
MFIFPLVATLVSFTFSFLLLRQYIERRKPYQLVWAISLSMFGLGALAETISTASSWTPFLAKMYYLFGATLIVGFLALGSLYLSRGISGRNIALASIVSAFIMWIPIYGLKMFSEAPLAAIIVIVLYLALIIGIIANPERTATVYLTIILITAVLALWQILAASVDPALLSQTKGWKAINRTYPIKSAAFSLNVVGSLILVIAAVYSAIQLLRKKIMQDRALANILIAVGVIVVAAGGTAGGLLGLGGQAALSVPMSIGVIIMFIGFILASRPSQPSGSSSAK